MTRTPEEEEEFAYRKLPSLRAAEPWIDGYAERFSRKWMHGDHDVVTRATDELKSILKRVYVEGHADRLKEEVAEIKSETPKRTTRRRKR